MKKTDIAIIVIGIIAFILHPMGIVVLYGYVLYKLFMGTIFWYGANNTSKMVRNVVISTILCFPIGICEMIYIHTKNKEVKTEG